MNKQLLLSIALVGLILGWPRPAVAAAIEADGAATLASHRASPDKRINQLRTFLLSHGSPLATSAEQFVTEADRFGLDWRLVAAIAGVESSFGRFIPTGSYNGWGWGVFSGASDGVHFTDWNAAITQVSQGLRRNYVDRGSVTVEQIGRIYATSPVWAFKVRYFTDKIDKFVPQKPQLMEVLL